MKVRRPSVSRGGFTCLRDLTWSGTRRVPMLPISRGPVSEQLRVVRATSAVGVSTMPPVRVAR